MKTSKYLLDKLMEAWCVGKLEAVDEVIAPEYHIIHDPGDEYDGKIITREQFKLRLENSRRVFPDLYFDIKESMHQDDKAVICWYMSGTQLGEIPGLGITGNKINVPGMTIYYFKNEKITGHWQVMDRNILMMQLQNRGGK